MALRAVQGVALAGLLATAMAYLAEEVHPKAVASAIGLYVAGNSIGYPQNSTLFYPIWLYQQGFSYFNMGYAAAMSVLLLVVALAVTVLILRNSRRWVHYSGEPR